MLTGETGDEVALGDEVAWSGWKATPRPEKAGPTDWLDTNTRAVNARNDKLHNAC